MRTLLALLIGVALCGPATADTRASQEAALIAAEDVARQSAMYDMVTKARRKVLPAMIENAKICREWFEVVSLEPTTDRVKSCLAHLGYGTGDMP